MIALSSLKLLPCETTMHPRVTDLLLIALGVIMLAGIIAYFLRSRNKGLQEQDQRDRGVAYALEHLSQPAPLESVEKSIDNLTLQATTSSTFGEGRDSRAFDKGILEGIRLFLEKEAEAAIPLSRLKDRLMALVEEGGAAEAEVATAIAMIDKELFFERALKHRFRVMSYVYYDHLGVLTTCFTKYHPKGGPIEKYKAQVEAAANRWTSEQKA